MKSVMRQKFEELHGFEVCDDMDIQTEVAWDNWKRAWKAAMERLFGPMQSTKFDEFQNQLSKFLDPKG